MGARIGIAVVARQRAGDAAMKKGNQNLRSRPVWGRTADSKEARREHWRTGEKPSGWLDRWLDG